MTALLSELFPKPVQPAHPLPPMFEDNCKRCAESTMVKMECVYYIERKPYATYQCPACRIRLFLFASPFTPLLVWSDEFINQVDFSAFVDWKEKDREHKRAIRALRSGAAAEHANSQATVR